MNELKNPVTRKWTAPMHHWGQILSQLSIIFGDQLKLDLRM